MGVEVCHGEPFGYKKMLDVYYLYLGISMLYADTTWANVHNTFNLPQKVSSQKKYHHLLRNTLSKYVQHVPTP